MNIDIPCVCPPLSTGAPRHTTDTITLRDALGFRAARAARNSILVVRELDPESSIGDVLAALSEVYLIEGIESWSLVDQRNKPLELSRKSIRAFMAEHPEEAGMAADRADDLYQEAVFAPLVKRASTSSQPSQTEPSTSAEIGSTSTPRKRSKPSSTTTTQTDGTATMYASRDGVYS